MPTMNKPTSVSNAILAIWVTLGISVISTVVSRVTGQITSAVFFGTLLLYGLYAVLPYKISVGRNWARYFYVVNAVLTVAVMLAGEYEGASKLDIIVSWFLLPVEAWIVFSLFRGTSTAWFEGQKSS
jgi:hypothetical protein